MKGLIVYGGFVIGWTAFSACNVTKQGMEKREGHPITIIPQGNLRPRSAGTIAAHFRAGLP
jgi:hypothetical protein